MPPSTGRLADDDDGMDNKNVPLTPQEAPSYLSSGDDESDDVGTDEEPDEVVFIPQDQAVWTLDELEILCPYKDEWVESARDQQATIVENAVKKLLAVRKQDPGPLRKKVRTWLRRKVKKRTAYGPGKPPSLHTVVAWYNDVELNKLLKEKHGVVPGDKARFIGLWKTELTALVNDLKTDPTRRKELKKMEDKRDHWMERGPPPDRRKS